MRQPRALRLSRRRVVPSSPIGNMPIASAVVASEQSHATTLSRLVDAHSLVPIWGHSAAQTSAD